MSNWERLRRMWPLLVLGAIFDILCLLDLRRSRTRRLPKPLWALIIMMSTPSGGILYLLFGKDRRGLPEPEAEQVGVGY